MDTIENKALWDGVTDKRECHDHPGFFFFFLVFAHPFVSNVYPPKYFVTITIEQTATICKN